MAHGVLDSGASSPQHPAAGRRGADGRSPRLGSSLLAVGASGSVAAGCIGVIVLETVRVFATHEACPTTALERPGGWSLGEG